MNEKRRVWVSKWALTYGLFEVETSDEGPCITFVHPWTGRECVATEGDWHANRHVALRQAEKKRHMEMRLLVSRLEALNNYLIREYEARDLTNGKLQNPTAAALQLKRCMDREGAENHWGDRGVPSDADIIGTETGEEMT